MKGMGVKIDTVSADSGCPAQLYSGLHAAPAISTLALPVVIGDNHVTLVAEDVTPAPYNQPPYPPAGDTDTGRCKVTAFAPSYLCAGAMICRQPRRCR